MNELAPPVLHERQAPDAAAPESTEPNAPSRGAAPGLFEALHRLARRQTVQLIIAPEDDVRVRLTAMAFPKSGGDSSPGSKNDEPLASDHPAFAPITLVATPRELDDSGAGLAALFAELREQHASLAEVRARATKAHEAAVAAEKRREEEARERKAKADPGGPLFGGAAPV